MIANPKAEMHNIFTVNSNHLNYFMHFVYQFDDFHNIFLWFFRQQSLEKSYMRFDLHTVWLWCVVGWWSQQLERKHSNDKQRTNVCAYYGERQFLCDVQLHAGYAMMIKGIAFALFLFLYSQWSFRIYLRWKFVLDDLFRYFGKGKWLLVVYWSSCSLSHCKLSVILIEILCHLSF